MGKHYEQLSAEERGVIFAMMREGCSMRAVGEALGRAPSTISRELRRNGYRPAHLRDIRGRTQCIAGGYAFLRAGRRARRLREKARRACKLDLAGLLWAQVRKLLTQGWSPEQIACTLRCVSYETIYSAIYALPRGRLRRELIGLLRQRRPVRHRRSRKEERRGKLTGMVSIHLRPPAACDRLLPGHWEGDFLVGARNASAVGTLVCRKTLFLMMVRMDGCTAQAALEGFTTAFAPLDPALRKTLTYDQGKEMALHAKLADSTGLKIYFADPHSPWQRGICENINGLIRQYLPKGISLAKFSQRELDRIAWSLNTRPRKTLGWRTPAEAFFEHCYMNRFTLPGVALVH